MQIHPITGKVFNAGVLSDELVAAGADLRTLVVRQFGAMTGEIVHDDAFSHAICDEVLARHTGESARAREIREVRGLAMGLDDLQPIGNRWAIVRRAILLILERA